MSIYPDWLMTGSGPVEPVIVYTDRYIADKALTFSITPKTLRFSFVPATKSFTAKPAQLSFIPTSKTTVIAGTQTKLTFNAKRVYL